MALQYHGTIPSFLIEKSRAFSLAGNATSLDLLSWYSVVTGWYMAYK